MAVANKLTAVLNFIALLCSFLVIAAGIWFQVQADEGCIDIHIIVWLVIVIGLIILILSVNGFVGATANHSKYGVSGFFVFCTGFFIALLFIISGAMNFVATGPDESYGVVNSSSWNKIRACLAHSNVCPKLTQHFNASHTSHISPLQSGCCKPPTICGYTFVNPTLWTNASNPTGDPDCKLWSNDQTRLCYDCNSCKAGVLGDLRTARKQAKIILTVSKVVLLCVYVIACFQYYKESSNE